MYFMKSTSNSNNIHARGIGAKPKEELYIDIGGNVKREPVG